MHYIKKFHQIGMHDVALVGGKAAALGEMIQALSAQICIPDGFVLTVDAYWRFVDYNNIRTEIEHFSHISMDPSNTVQLAHDAQKMRQLFLQGTFPSDLEREIAQQYQNLSEHYKSQDLSVAVRSSATAEDLPEMSFAGQFESFLHIQGLHSLLQACKRCFASLFTDRAIAYRVYKKVDAQQIALAIAVQKMVSADHAAAGVAFSLDPETGFSQVITINAAFGLGEAVVQGVVDPDEYYVSKPLLQQKYTAIVGKYAGHKDKKLIFSHTEQKPTKWVEVSSKEQYAFCLTDDEIIQLARMVMIIEEYYSTINGTWTPMDVEWAQDADRTLYIVQARPETVHAKRERATTLTQYILDPHQSPKLLLEGQSIGQKIVTGTVRIIKKYGDTQTFNKGDIIVTTMTDPDWVPLMQKSGGIITDAGGRTCHAAIVSRELGIPAIIGTENATSRLREGQTVTLDCSQGSTGYIYDGSCTFTQREINVTKLSAPPVSIMLNIAQPSQAFAYAALPHIAGVGLARLEFIISNSIKIHPMAIVHPDKITDSAVKAEIDAMTVSYTDKKQFFIDTLAYGIATITAAWYPKPVIVRFSDFKTNEYRNLVGGKYFESVEQNPMLGLRGASRYYSTAYTEAFALECAAIKKAREVIGLHNIMVMIPFVRSVHEAEQVFSCMHEYGLSRGAQDLKVYMMVEIPSNVILIDQFSTLFDGFSIGSNDLTQFTLAVDRDAAELAYLFDERDQAVKKMIQLAIEGAHAHKKPIGICGQAPSDYPEIITFLTSCGIDSISLNPDAVIPFLMNI